MRNPRVGKRVLSNRTGDRGAWGGGEGPSLYIKNQTAPTSSPRTRNTAAGQLRPLGRCKHEPGIVPCTTFYASTLYVYSSQLKLGP